MNPHPARWYSVSRDGRATLCKDKADAQETAGQCDKFWPLGRPHRATLLCEQDALDAEVAAKQSAIDMLNTMNDSAMADIERLRAVLRECQSHLACNAVTDDLVALYERVRRALVGG